MSRSVAGLLLTATAASGGLVVTSYRTVAQTNGYTPTSQTQYFAEQRLENISPAVADVSGDWTGPNADGTPNTWRFVGASRSTSTTTITPDSYTVESAASFSYTLDTTEAFVDPRMSSLIFGPGGAANYRGFFETDVPLLYTITSQLNQRGRAVLSSFDGPIIFNESNSTSNPRIVDLFGTIPPGRYQLLATTGFGTPNLPPGTNFDSSSGGFESLVFSARIPEPCAQVILILVSVSVACRRRGL